MSRLQVRFLQGVLGGDKNDEARGSIFGVFRDSLVWGCSLYDFPGNSLCESDRENCRQDEVIIARMWRNGRRARLRI